MSEKQAPPVKRMRLRYDGVCRDCGATLFAGERADYDPAARKVCCLACADSAADARSAAAADGGQVSESPWSPPAVDPEPLLAILPPAESGVAGASARREHERRVARRDQRVRERHPRLGGVILALTEEPSSTRVWATGATGEEVLGRHLDQHAGEGFRVLHDRRIPGTRANIDHIVVSATGVFVIDAKRYRGKRPHLRIEGGILRPRTETLMVGSRNCDGLVSGVIRQVALVLSALETKGFSAPVDVRGLLCFLDADWPLIGGSFTTRGVDVLWPKKAVERMTGNSSLSADDVDRLHRAISSRFPSA